MTTRRRGACMVTRAEFQGENELLTALSASDYLLLRPQLKEVALQQGDVLQAYGERMRDAVVRYSELRLAQTQQAAACNALHGAEARLSRWLLQSSDIIGADVVPLTQEFLSQMLGVRRTTVTAIARSLQETGMIRYSRGRIQISDRKRLESSACEC